jgi:hypothetical protein
MIRAVCKTAYCGRPTLEKLNNQNATGPSVRSVLKQHRKIQMLDVTIPTTDGRELKMKRHTKPEKVRQFLFDQPGLELPAQPRPKSRLPAFW